MNTNKHNNTCTHSSNPQKIHPTKAKNWQKEKQTAITAYNQFTAKHGQLADEHRLF